MFLFRDEYICEMERAIVVEVPEQGHATYIFSRPANLEHWSESTRGGPASRTPVYRPLEFESSSTGSDGEATRLYRTVLRINGLPPSRARLNSRISFV